MLPLRSTGTVHAVAWWWDAWTDPSRECEPVTSRPGSTNPPDHWRQAVTVLPTPLPCVGGSGGDKLGHLEATVCHNDDDIWFRDFRLRAGVADRGQGNVANDANTPSDGAATTPVARQAPVRVPVCTCLLHVALVPQHLWRINGGVGAVAGGTWMANLRRACAAAAQAVTTAQGKTCLVIGDNPLLPTLAYLAGCEQVLVLPASSASAVPVLVRCVRCLHS